MSILFESRLFMCIRPTLKESDIIIYFINPNNQLHNLFLVTAEVNFFGDVCSLS